MKRMSNKVVLITGSSSGIGRTTALRMAEEGADVVVTYNTNKENGEEVVRRINELGQKAIAIKVDITNRDEVENMVNKALGFFGRVDSFVNCAGGHNVPSQIRTSKCLEKGNSLQESYLWDYIIEVNLKGPFNCVAAILPHMQSLGEGSIILTSSTAKDGIQQSHYEGIMHRVSYSSSKEGLIGMVRTLSNYLAENKIRVNCVIPGPISDNEETRNAFLIPLNRRGKTLEVANAILFLASEEASYVTGQQLYVSGGFMGGGFNPAIIK